MHKLDWGWDFKSGNESLVSPDVESIGIFFIHIIHCGLIIFDGITILDGFDFLYVLTQFPKNVNYQTIPI